MASESRRTTGGEHFLRRSALPLLNLLLVVLIVWLDWLTPAGVVVGILLAIPILLASVWDDPRHIWLTFLVAMAGKAVAAIFGTGPISPAAVWIPNRVFAFCILPFSVGLALRLQRRRLDAERARDSALSARDLNRLLMSLLAHDLRSPLTLAGQALGYVEDAAARGESLERELLADVRARLQRSLRAIEIVLAVARAEVPGPESPSLREPPVPARLGEEIEAEAASFAEEARTRGKTLELELEGLDDRVFQVDTLVVRQALAILLDNAVRHALPGPVRIGASVAGGELRVRIADCGPGLSVGGHGGAGGAGMGLALSRALVARAGGSLDVERDAADGTVFLLRLPAVPAPGGGTRPRRTSFDIM